MLSELEKALENLVDVYHNYSLLKGNHHALYKDDLKELLRKECSQYTQQKDPETIFKELDINEDKAINFEEYLVLLVKVGVAAHKDSHKH